MNYLDGSKIKVPRQKHTNLKYIWFENWRAQHTQLERHWVPGSAGIIRFNLAEISNLLSRTVGEPLEHQALGWVSSSDARTQVNVNAMGNGNVRCALAASKQATSCSNKKYSKDPRGDSSNNNATSNKRHHW